ncbi:MAG: hypothetical protein IKA87_06405 [Lentisphaeria bacterium]|nr:hypothetical protein [Lentisphaeria bacterium]
MNEKIKIGWAKCDITPAGPTMLAGQMGNRLSTGVLDHLFTSALALECGNEKAIIISADLCGIRMGLMKQIRQKISAATGVPGENVTASATHTHTGPQYGNVIPRSEWYKNLRNANLPLGVGNRGVDVEEMRRQHPDFVDSEQYFYFLVEKISGTAIKAWENRTCGKVAFGCGTAVVGESRRLTMAEQGGLMYALEDDPAMLNAEGHVDHTVNVLSTYTEDGDLTGIVINVACPSQVSEAMSVVSADYWNEVRSEVAARFGKDIFVLPQCSAAGDCSPHKLLGRRADERMLLLRGQQQKPNSDWKWGKRVYNLDYGLGRRRELARRIAVALEDVLPVIAGTAESAPVMKKGFTVVELPPRLITAEEADEAGTKAERMIVDYGETYTGLIPWYMGVVERFKNPPASVPMEIHTLRIGDMVFATNSFELYLDYGDRIKGRSKAVQTFLVQLSAGAGTYLPSGRSGGKGYGSVPASSIVTVAGGNMLVEESVKAINMLFD